MIFHVKNRSMAEAAAETISATLKQRAATRRETRRRRHPRRAETAAEGRRETRRGGAPIASSIKNDEISDDRGWRPWLHDRLCRREHRELAKLLHERAVVHSPQWRSLVGWRWLSATESAMQKSHGCHLRFSSINLYWLFAATIYYIIKYMSSMSLNQYYYRLEL